MISIDDHAPTDPSSSNHHPHQQQLNTHDLKVSETDLKSTDADLDDTNNPLSNFSIRDYVFSLRSKDIACNWPFSSTSLQLCLKHGIKNLLPPFQSLDCLRNNSSLTKCSLESHLTDEELISSFDGKPANDQFKLNKKLVSTNLSGSDKESQSHLQGGYKESQSHLQGRLGQTRSKEKPRASFQKSGNASVNIVSKKTRFIIKVNSGVEHVAPNSETMASKVCPVCKIFSSSSNTTLNAHIDQCLTGEGTMKWTDNPKVVVKHKVKPRKMRLMVDIYKTAPHCTVEELDRRNGTSWATNSSFPAQESQFQEEEEKEEPRPTKVNPEVADNEGDVYIDTNGTKVRILSVPKTGPSNNLNGGKLPKGVKGSKMMIMSKKNNLLKKKHHKKYLKLTPNSSKLCSPKLKIIDDSDKSGDTEDVMAKNCSKDKRGKETMKVVDLAISRPQWACSKRTGLSKKFNDKNRSVELKCHKMRDLVVENYDKSFSGSDRSSSQGRKRMMTSLSLSKQPLVRIAEFRKKATPMHNDDDDGDDDDGDGSPDARPSQHSSSSSDDDDDDDDDDCEGTSDSDNRSKGGKFSSLSRNLSFPAARFSFKRKFSAVEKSCVKSVDRPSQDPSKEQSRMEEHGDGSSDASLSQHPDDDDDDDDDDCEGTQDVDHGSKGSKFSSLSRNLSFPEAKFSFKRKFATFKKSCEKSVDGTSQDSSKEQSRMEEHTAINKKQETRSITSKSSNEESSVGIQTVNGNQLESVKNGTLLSIRVPSFMGLSSTFDPGFSNQECIELYQDQICSTNRAPNDVEKQENYFQQIDPIPIPGPPGSFLPASPGGEMVSEEQIHETRVHSSENQHHDTIDRDSMSNSPVSTISNSRSSCGKDDMYIKPYFNGDTGFTETGQSESSFKNDQPCCCSRKEAALNYQDSYNLRKQPTESTNFKSEMFPIRNLPNSSGIDSIASPSKPVLRLMGKNLTVVETDEDEFKPPQSNQQQPQRPVIFDQYQNGFEAQHFKVQPSRSPVDFGTVNRGFAAPIDCYGNGGPYLGPLRSHYVHNALDSQVVSGRNVYNAASSSRPVKEIVIIDGSPENEDDHNTMRNRLLRGNIGQMNALYTAYPPYVGGGSGGSSVFHGGSFQTPLDNENVGGKWNIGSSSAYQPPSYP